MTFLIGVKLLMELFEAHCFVRAEREGSGMWSASVDRRVAWWIKQLTTKYDH